VFSTGLLLPTPFLYVQAVHLLLDMLTNSVLGRSVNARPLALRFHLFRFGIAVGTFAVVHAFLFFFRGFHGFRSSFFASESFFNCGNFFQVVNELEIIFLGLAQFGQVAKTNGFLLDHLGHDGRSLIFVNFIGSLLLFGSLAEKLLLLVSFVLS